MRFASIDIGSNAVRLLFCNVNHKPSGEVNFKKASLIRVPLRLGEEVFTSGIIPPEKEEKLLKTMKAFALLIEVNEVISFRAFATSAMRDASNSSQIVKRIFNESGIAIEVIDGKKEAEVIYSNHIAENLNPKKPYLYIDVGGGSTELTLFYQNRIVDSRSFNIGTIRILKEKAENSEWEAMRDWIYKSTASYTEITGIGSGGNINKIIGLAKKKDDRQINYNKIKELYNQLKTFSLNERISVLGLNPDRADVIVPACEIFLFIMKFANISKVMVPEVGLSDGIIHLLFEEYMSKKA